jgi:hypothetical protein
MPIADDIRAATSPADIIVADEAREASARTIAAVRLGLVPGILSSSDGPFQGSGTRTSVQRRDRDGGLPDRRRDFERA